MKVLAHQPGLFPRLHWYHRVLSSDVLVVLCCAQYERRDAHSRLFLRDSRGTPVTLSVPVRHGSPQGVSYRDALVDDSQSWRQKHLRALELAYARAPFFPGYRDRLAQVYREGFLRDESVGQFLTATQDFALAELGYGGRLVYDHEIGARGKGSDWMLAICLALGASAYLCGRTACEAYLDSGMFKRAGVEVWVQDWRCPQYPQLGRGFIPNLSILDLLFNVGPEAAREVLKPDDAAWEVVGVG